MFSLLETPQGLACLTITQDGFSKFNTHDYAASPSTILLNDNSFP